ncbi:hypothetical protein [Peribacillus frigoritolerans]|uniref:hypothetical protein n=1 Tax=Peribacillus castrilensis TaxID=2897690 RepID=UPI003DA40A68
MRYKIDFKVSFFVCILVMPFSEIWKFLEKRPEAFPYGDEIYHTLAIIFFIFSNLAIGIAAAIVFYFMALFLDKKKNYEIYQDVRSDVLRLLYNHINILREIKEFKELKVEKKPGEWFHSIKDIRILIESFYKIHSEEQKEIFKNHLEAYFSIASYETLNKITEEFEADAKVLEEKKNIRFFKHSKDLIESITTMMRDDGDLAIIFDLYIHAKKEDDKRAYREELVKDYYTFLEGTIDLYEDLSAFMESIEKKQVLPFIKMVD